MTWGCLTAYGTGELIRINGNINSASYIDILSKGLVKTIENFPLNPKKAIFMHDNAPPHMAKITKEWLKNNKIKVMEWPAQSPDLNPIENLWEIIDKKIRKRTVKASNCNELWEIIKEEWANIDEEIVRKLYISMTTRISKLYEADGGYTKY
jgi:transposase